MRNSFLLIVVLIFFASCKSVKNITGKQRELPNITEGRLFKNIASNELNYSTIYAKKVDLSLKDKKESHNLKAILRIQRDSFISVAVSAPLGIEVARLLLTPDSVKFINQRSKEYFISDYSYFINKFDVGLTFDCFQKMLTNQFFDFESCTTDVDRGKHYKFDKSGNDYVLFTLEERALGRKLKRLYKKRKKNKEYSLILQKIHINPDCFRPNMVSIEDLEEKVGMSINYLDIKDFNGHLFPSRIIFKVTMDSGDLQLELDFNRLEFDVEVSPSFKISSKYKRMSDNVH